jgi:hypothetical protein
MEMSDQLHSWAALLTYKEPPAHSGYGGTVCLDVVMKKKSAIFWDITPCSPLRNLGVISQKMVLFITTAVRTSNPT